MAETIGLVVLGIVAGGWVTLLVFLGIGALGWTPRARHSKAPDRSADGGEESSDWVEEYIGLSNGPSGGMGKFYTWEEEKAFNNWVDRSTVRTGYASDCITRTEMWKRALRDTGNSEGSEGQKVAFGIGKEEFERQFVRRLELPPVETLRVERGDNLSGQGWRGLKWRS